MSYSTRVTWGSWLVILWAISLSMGYGISGMSAVMASLLSTILRIITGP